LLASSCYVFAGVIWECMRLMRPSAHYEQTRASNRGKCRWFRYTPTDSMKQDTHRELEAKLSQIEKELEERRNVSDFERFIFVILIHDFPLKAFAFEKIGQRI
jgi:hypothetical protein